jgi:hypothetical protein
VTLSRVTLSLVTHIRATLTIAILSRATLYRVKLT